VNVIELTRVAKNYGDFALSEINLALPEGQILGLVGENGAGKTTLFRLIMNAVHADAGEIRVFGTAVTDPAFVALRQRIGVVQDEPGFPLSLTARQIGEMFAGIYSGWERNRFAARLRQFSLPEDKPFHQLSRGMRMKLSIAAALSHGASLLLLDEPTGGLDVVARDEILTAFFEFTREGDHSILISSHIVTDLERLCDRIALLQGGRIRLHEEKDTLLERYALWPTTMERLRLLSAEAVDGMEQNPYGVRALLRRNALPADAVPETELEQPSLEEIILLLTKGGMTR